MEKKEKAAAEKKAAAGKKTATVKKAAPAKKAAEEKKAAPAKKPAARKPVKETVYLQYLGKEIDKDELTKQVKAVWTKQMKRKVSELESMTLYLKPEENMVYYVINGEVTGSIDL